MPTDRCLYCYEPLDGEQRDFHTRCSRKFFGTPVPPELPYDLDQVYELANQVVKSSVTITGVQPKLSLGLESYKEARKRSRFTIVGLWGRYVLKPPVAQYPCLPENEDVTLHMAEAMGIRTVSHSLIRFKSGELAYISRRLDRPDGTKLAMEDACQLSERLTEDKYKGSMEQVGKLIRRFSENPGFDIVEFFQVALFSFLTGNADMHLKNFSLLRSADGMISLAPAYDLVATRLVLPSDSEEMALTINGKKSHLGRNDFQTFAGALNLHDTVTKNVFDLFLTSLAKALQFLDKSFLSDPMREKYANLIRARAARLGIEPTFAARPQARGDSSA